MAKATRAEVEVVTKAEGFKLMMTMKEAEFVRAVMKKIGGHPSYTDRFIADSINDALEEAGVSVGDLGSMSGHITCLEQLVG